MKQVRQHYAYNEEGNLMEIHSTHKGDGHVYYCPYFALNPKVLENKLSFFDELNKKYSFDIWSKDNPESIQL